MLFRSESKVQFRLPEGSANPALMISVHGGGGIRDVLGSDEAFFQQGFATLVFDAYAMQGIPGRDSLFWARSVTNEARQRMIYEAQQVGSVPQRQMQPQQQAQTTLSQKATDYTETFMSRFPYFDPQGTDEDSMMIRAIDDAVAADDAERRHGLGHLLDHRALAEGGQRCDEVRGHGLRLVDDCLHLGFERLEPVGLRLLVEGDVQIGRAHV